MKELKAAYTKKFGEHLKELIQRHNTDVQTVASIGNIESKQVYRIISAENEPKITTLLPIAKGLGIEMKDLFDFDFDFSVEGFVEE
ncbi:helix-turn-helix domain-containing protein [Zhouia amylolytica]|uniref:HTH cro/C1-type domain-containing protein n=1 Tax=Zhouia amylolytica AD3 TaxID=1286632 RepID=W2UNR8_9FLAO|nr:helix-turn-helix domain-containing protein [Zhouia amylolytica]ETN95785.1 hypothetical protein P278_15070 [Zhouia amylolytica AD3]MCQ0112058.1 helix-turn-helix domain-containing protein [Zhouia amylolytica]